MMRAPFRWLLMGLPLTFAACSSGPVASDPELARRTLGEALQSWQAGRAPGTLQEGSNPIVFVDRQCPQWKLLHFEVLPETKPSGFDVRVGASLHLQGTGGKSVQQKAFYSVSTAPRRVVVRAEEP